MKYANINLGVDVEIDPSSSINNVSLGDHVRIARRCSIYGSAANILEIGRDSYVGMNTIINGFAAKIKIGSNVSIAQNVNIMADSGPNASMALQRLFPIIAKEVLIGDNSWIGASVIIMPGVTLGDFCIVAAHSYVNKSFPAFSIIGGNPAKLIKSFTVNERNELMEND